MGDSGFFVSFLFEIPHSSYFKCMFKLWAVGLERPRPAAPRVFHAPCLGLTAILTSVPSPSREARRAKTTEWSHVPPRPEQSRQRPGLCTRPISDHSPLTSPNVARAPPAGPGAPWLPNPLSPGPGRCAERLGTPAPLLCLPGLGFEGPRSTYFLLS